MPAEACVASTETSRCRLLSYWLAERVKLSREPLYCAQTSGGSHALPERRHSRGSKRAVRRRRRATFARNSCTSLRLLTLLSHVVRLMR